MSLKEKLSTEILEPKLKAYYNLSEVSKILHTTKLALYTRISFLFDVNYKLPKDLKKIKNCIKKCSTSYLVKYRNIPKIENLIVLLKEKYKGAFNDYYTVKFRTGNDRKVRLGDNNTKGFINSFIKVNHRTNKMKKAAKKPVKVDKYYKIKMIKKKRIKTLNKIYKEENL